MGYLEMVRGNIVNLDAGHLIVGHGAEATRVAIPAFGLAEAALTNAQLRAFHEKYADRPYMRFEQKLDSYWVPKEMGASKGALQSIPVTVVPEEPIPLSQVFKVVPTRKEYEGRLPDLLFYLYPTKGVGNFF